MSILKSCKGWCDVNATCAYGLICQHREGNETVPGCPFDELEAGVNYCAWPFPYEELRLTFSLRREPPIVSHDVMAGLEPELIDRVSLSLRSVLCNRTSLSLVEPSNGTILCSEHQNDTVVNSLQPAVEGIPEFDVRDATNQIIMWTEWTSSYRLLRLGSHNLTDFHQMTQVVLFSSIEDKSFDALLGDNVYSSVTGQENATFMFDDEIEVDAIEPRDIKPMHNMRIAGITLFIINVVTLWLLQLQSRRHKMKEEEDSVAVASDMGLSTDQGVNRMLQLARCSMESPTELSMNIASWEDHGMEDHGMEAQGENTHGKEFLSMTSAGDAYGREHGLDYMVRNEQRQTLQSSLHKSKIAQERSAGTICSTASDMEMVSLDRITFHQPREEERQHIFGQRLADPEQSPRSLFLSSWHPSIQDSECGIITGTFSDIVSFRANKSKDLKQIKSGQRWPELASEGDSCRGIYRNQELDSAWSRLVSSKLNPLSEKTDLDSNP